MLTLEKFPELRIITGGTFDDPNWLKIDRHVWTRSAQDWWFSRSMWIASRKALRGLE